MPTSNDTMRQLEPSPQGQPTKIELRHALRTLRARYTGTDRNHRSERAALAVLGWTELTRARRVAAFVSLTDEIDTAPLMRELRNRGIDIVLPRVERATVSLSFVLVEDEAELVDGPFGLKEPEGKAVELGSIDIVVMPGLGFDRFGGRLGYGVGYYDRALAGYTGLSVGYCYASQMLTAALPQAPHDVRVTAVAHEDGLVHCEPS